MHLHLSEAPLHLLSKVDFAPLHIMLEEAQHYLRPELRWLPPTPRQVVVHVFVLRTFGMGGPSTEGAPDSEPRDLGARASSEQGLVWSWGWR